MTWKPWVPRHTRLGFFVSRPEYILCILTVTPILIFSVRSWSETASRNHFLMTLHLDFLQHYKWLCTVSWTHCEFPDRTWCITSSKEKGVILLSLLNYSDQFSPLGFSPSAQVGATIHNEMWLLGKIISWINFDVKIWPVFTCHSVTLQMYPPISCVTVLWIPHKKRLGKKMLRETVLVEICNFVKTYSTNKPPSFKDFCGTVRQPYYCTGAMMYIFSI